MSAFRDLVTKAVDEARGGLAGRRADARVAKAAQPLPQQLDEPAALDDAPPVQQASAEDMLEGIDLTSPVEINSLYQRYGPQDFHKAMTAVPEGTLHAVANNPATQPRVTHALRAAAAVRKAGLFDQDYPDSSPSTPIPARPSAGPSGKPGTWVSQAPPTLEAASYHDPGAWTSAPVPQGGVPTGQPGTWQYDPATEIVPDPDKEPIGVGDDDDCEYSGAPKPGDLVAFRGPGGTITTTTVVQVVQGRAIGEFDGQTISFPADALTPHSPGGSAGAPTEPTIVRKANDPYYGGTATDRDDYHPPLVNPDDGAPVTPYDTAPPVNSDPTYDTGGGNAINGTLTPIEQSLIERAIMRGGYRPTETAALKALKAGQGDDEVHAVVTGALKRLAFAAPGHAAAAQTIIAKLQ